MYMPSGLSQNAQRLLKFDRALTTLENPAIATVAEKAEMAKFIGTELGATASTTAFTEPMQPGKPSGLKVALSVLATEASRALLKSPKDSLTNVFGDPGIYQAEVDRAVGQYKTLPPAIAAHLAEAGNAAALSERFPQLIAERIAEAQKPETAELPTWFARKALVTTANKAGAAAHP